MRWSSTWRKLWVTTKAAGLAMQSTITKRSPVPLTLGRCRRVDSIRTTRAAPQKLRMLYTMTNCTERSTDGTGVALFQRNANDIL